MVRQEQDREDLVRDARAFVRRGEIATPAANFPSPVFFGFRASGAVSIYFDQDPVYHFTSKGKLRRGYVSGELLKADTGRLHGMVRYRTSSETQLQSRLLSEVEQSEVLRTGRAVLISLLNVLERGEYTVTGKRPDDDDVVEEIVEWLDRLCETPLKVASAPNVV